MNVARRQEDSGVEAGGVILNPRKENAADWVTKCTEEKKAASA